MLNIMNPPADWSTLKKLIWLRGTPINGGEELTVSGTPPLSLPNSLGKPLKAWSVEVSPYQEGTGDPAPDNVRPIHGTDKVTVWTSGKNLLPNITGTRTAGYAYYIGQSNGNTYPIHLFGGQAYTLTFTTDSISGGWGYYKTNGDSNILVGLSGASFTPSADMDVQFWVYSNTTFTSVTDFQLEFGSTATPYTPYLAPSQTVIDVPPLSANQWDEEWEVGSYSSTGQKVPTQGGRVRCINKISVLPNTSYYALKGVYILCQYSENEQFISFTQLGVDSPSNTGHLFTTGSTTHYVTFATYANYGATYNHDIAINLPSSVTTYNPYNATVYTGTIGSEGGESRSAEVDLSTLNWITRVTGNINVEYSAALPIEYIGPVYATPINWLTEDIKYCGTTNHSILSQHVDDYTVGVYSFTFNGQKTAVIYALLPIGTSTDTLGKMVYEIADPITFPLTAPTIPTPTGSATTWATAEDGTADGMEVTYVGKA